MRLVTSVEEIYGNVRTLEREGRLSVAGPAFAYISLIKRGTCFLPYESNGQVAFAPSRFLGYADNSLSRHEANDSRDGRVTNSALNALLGLKPVSDVLLENYYRHFCETIGIEPSQTGAFGVERKYWVTVDAKIILDTIALNAIGVDTTINETEREQLAKARIGQGIFRKKLIEAWKKCGVTGCAITAILRASHIKPWRSSTNQERLDEYNGLLLSPNVDALFDAGLISFENDGSLIISPALDRADLLALGCPTDVRIQVGPRHQPYLEHHRTEVFVNTN